MFIVGVTIVRFRRRNFAVILRGRRFGRSFELSYFFGSYCVESGGSK